MVVARRAFARSFPPFILSFFLLHSLRLSLARSLALALVPICVLSSPFSFIFIFLFYFLSLACPLDVFFRRAHAEKRARRQ